MAALDPKIKIEADAVVCLDTLISGEVTIKKGTVCHPRCKIVAQGGPIEIGENNIIEELVVIVNKTNQLLRIGDNNTFEVGAQIYAHQIGDNNVIETKAFVSEASEVGNGCVVGTCVRIPAGERVQDGLVVFGPDNSTRKQIFMKEAYLSLHLSHLDILAKTLPKYHRLKNQPSTAPTTPTSSASSNPTTPRGK
eukprot:TRINITY_DN1523_c0_g1_i2.p1 TRINITY_DN1523_c0_g1~~TRINITY_DN1523_c0_g1_i2.p1  ORF type:complete len:194 (-),score=34.72 TRINITY_DN1523_c0_g1_i2:48-629(-)